MKRIKVWDPLVRIFHWSLVVGFAANIFLIDDDSDLHQWVGYAIVALIGLRIIWGIVGARHARFSDFPLDPNAAITQLSEIATGRKRIHLGHTPLGAMMIYNLLGTIILIGVSGYLMTTNMFWGAEWVEELHEFFVGWAQVSIVLHVAAVIWESRRTGVNLPRAMVTGYKTFSNGGPHQS
ncbi:MAG: cytochrome b/b6 domain-containing protein [Rhodobacterales bacterium]|nr:cytochrome b/b6 domain-containing protein [Rhodobacterales bacterium]